MSSPPSGLCVGWKVYENGEAVIDETGCRVWWSGVVVDHWGRGRVRTTRSGPDHQHNVQLFAGRGGAERAIARTCQPYLRGPDGAVHAAQIPRLAGGSAPADCPAGAGYAMGAAVRWTHPAGRQHLQQLLSGRALGQWAEEFSGHHLIQEEM